MNRYLQNSSLTALTLALTCAFPCLSTAQTSEIDNKPALTGEVKNEVVVTASYARSLAAAEATKRRAGYEEDVITSTDIGKFPAQNVAEALQLIPGVTITRPRGEGLYVSVRGLGPQFQETLLNGRPIALNDLVENGGAQGRQFRFEMLPAEFVSQIDVVKTPTANMTEGALGGNIDVRTVRPFDVGSRVSLNLRGTYTDHTGQVKPNATLIASHKFNDTFGILGGFQYWAKDVRNDRFLNFGWNLNKFSSVLGPGDYTPTRTRPTIETEKRDRLSGLISSEWRPTSQLRTSFDLLVTRLDVNYDEFGIDVYPDDTSVAGHRPTLAPGSAKLDGDTVDAATINDVRFMASREHSLDRHDLFTAGLAQTWTPDAWSFGANINYSYAHSFHPSIRDSTLRSRLAFFAPLTYDSSAGYKNLPTFTTTKNLNDPANYSGFQLGIAPKNSKDSDAYGRLDGAREFGSGFLRKIEFGGEYHWRQRDYWRRDWVLNSIYGIPATTLGSSFYEPLPYENFLPGVPGNAPHSWLAPVTSAFYNALVTPQILAQPLTAGDLQNDYVVTERVGGAYVQADYGFDAGPVPITGNLGVRYVHSEEDDSGNILIGGAPTAVTYNHRYDDPLPSFNLRAELRPDLIGRVAVSRVLTRPNVTDTAPRITVSTDSPTASGGNPALTPFLATQLDGSLEWYVNSQTMLSGAVFYKDLDNYITAENININVPGRGTVLLSTNVNGGTVKLSGVELDYNQVFRFLPKPLDGLGVQATFTQLALDASYMAGARPIRDQLLGLSKQSYNLVGFYDEGPFSARISYVWRDKYLSGIGSTTQAPTYTDAFGSLDGSLSYRVNRHVLVSVEGINLAGAYQYVYNDAPTRFGEINYYGRTILFGVRADF